MRLEKAGPGQMYIGMTLLGRFAKQAHFTDKKKASETNL